MMISTATPTDAETANQNKDTDPVDLLVIMLRRITIDWSPNKS